jgi:hypothetical protein
MPAGKPKSMAAREKKARLDTDARAEDARQLADEMAGQAETAQADAELARVELQEAQDRVTTTAGECEAAIAAARDEAAARIAAAERDAAERVRTAERDRDLAVAAARQQADTAEERARRSTASQPVPSPLKQ